MVCTGEAQAADAARHYKSIFEAVGDALIVFDERLRVVSANRSFYRLFRVSPAETAQKHVDELGGGGWLRDFLEKTIAGDEEFRDCEVERDFPAVGRRTMLLGGRRIDRGKGCAPLVLLALKDVTERKNEENGLEATALIVDNAPDLVSLHDRQGRYLYVNKAMEKHVGRPRKEIVGKTFEEAGRPPGVAAALRAAFGKVLDAKKEETVELSLDGRTYQSFIEPGTDGQGNVVSFAVYSRDITAMRRAEEALRLSESRFRAIFEQSPLSMMLFSPDGRALEVNRSWEELWGYARDTRKEYLNYLKRYNILHDRQLAAKGILPYIRKGFSGETRDIPVTSYVPAEAGLPGRPRSLKAFIFPVKDGAGRILQVVLMHVDLTGLVEAERALRESEEKYRTLVERANDGIIIVQDGVIKYANPRMAALDGSSIDQLVGTPFTAHVAPGEVPKVAANYRRRIAGEKVPASYEAVLRRRNGESAPSEISAAMVGYRGKPATLVVIHDISRYKRTEEELRRKEREFRSLAENSPDVILRVGRDIRFLYANPRAETLFGRSRAEIVGKTGGEIGLPAALVDSLDALARSVFAAEKKRMVNFEFAHGERHFSARFVPEFDEKGTMVSLLSISRDITGLKKTEETLRRDEYELRSLADNSPDLIVRMDSGLRYKYVNSAYERLTGVPRERIVGKTNEELGMSSQLMESWQRALKKVIESGQEYAMEFDVGSLFGKRFFAARLIPEFVKSGRVETVLAIARDITERVRAEEQLRYVSFHDAVTGLFNRAFFEEELRRIDTERELPISIIMGDVNNLKLANDVFGHQEGDRLLRAIAESIRNACRDTDVIARWGGDEFAVILPKTGSATAAAVCARIDQAAAESRGTAVRPSIALGAAVKEKADQNIYQAVRRAEQAMYDNKLANGRKNQGAVIASLQARAREKMPGMALHIERERAYARRFGNVLGLDEDQVKSLQQLIELHDIGMAVTPREVLEKPGRLTQEEWNQVRHHPEAGYRVAKSFPDTARVSDEIFAHDEHWDGGGYPRGLKGREIPFLARIFAIIEAYDVMTHPRSYAPALSREEAIAELRRNAGRQFDPDLVVVFIDAVIAQETVPAAR